VRYVAIIFGVVALGFGIAAAICWLEASKDWVEDPYPSDGSIFNPEPGDYAVPMLRALSVSARQNKIAAVLTAVSVLCAAIGNFASLWPANSN
jgi:hypothetical protein